jgi:arylsulfatase
LTRRIAILAGLAIFSGVGLTNASAQTDKPNILVIFGDDIGQANLSRYTHGLVGYMTPNIDRVGEEGMTFTDYYAETVAQQAGRRSLPASRRCELA